MKMSELIKQISFPASIVDTPPGSVAVAANFYAGLFGGPLSQLLKCLAAVKICAEYKNNGVVAVPVCLVRKDAPPGFLQGEINLIDRHSKLYCLKTAGREETSQVNFVGREDAKRIFEEIERIFPDGDRESLSALKEAFVSDQNLVPSCARWLKYLLKDYGVTIVEYDVLLESNNSSDSKSQVKILPVSIFVADSTEIAEYDKVPRDHDDVPPPIIRLCPNVTISNARSLKTLNRYGLDLERLFDGKENVLDSVSETMKSDVPDRLQKLRDETRAVFEELSVQEPAIFAGRGEHSGRIRKSRTARIVYQLEKIQRHSDNALANREASAKNRICKACDFLAPLGRRQQDTLGGAQIPLSFGMAGLRALYEQLDISTQNHQLIEMN